MAGRQDGSGRRFGYGAVEVEVVKLEVGEVSRLGSATSRASRDYLMLSFGALGIRNNVVTSI